MNSMESGNKSTTKDLINLRARIRHSAAHVMANAIQRLFPEAKFGVGPPTNDGFYYDLELDRALTPNDLDQIESLMREIIAANHSFIYTEHTRSQIRSLHKDQPYKLELIEGLSDSTALSTYTHGTFTDLCQGPHVDSTGKIPAIKLLSIAGAYWRGDENRPMLQRIYGTAFETPKALKIYLQRIAEAEKRDHRKLGQDLNLFMFDPIAPASPFFLPKGTIVYQLLMDFVRKLYLEYEYQEVITPQIYLSDLWKRSGHYDNYRENMYFITADDREMGVKPMNCPAHALIYASQLHSYRELPLRIADFGRLHRFERSGVTHGLTRVRSFAQDDAHIFCTPEQIHDEVRKFIEMLLESYKVFDFDEPRVMLSLRPQKRVGSDSIWDTAETALRSVLEASDLSYEAVEGEGAFYGPKIDFFVPDAIGREWQLGTVQLDFSLPESFNLEYIGQDGSSKRPVVIHRAMLGAIERFMGILIEHYGGAFPLWLAPIQGTIIPITDRNVAYASEIRNILIKEGLRIDVDTRNERMNLKIREAQLQKIPYMLVIGDRETLEKTIAVRTRNNGNLGTMSIEQLGLLLRTEVISGHQTNTS